VASAPGKAVVLGEYAVLDGVPALVVAVNRRAIATITASDDTACELRTRMPDETAHPVDAAGRFGMPLVDLVIADTAVAPFRALVDSSAFFERGRKLGIGSSAAALCAWTGAFRAWMRQQGMAATAPALDELIALHRAFQGGAGSGVDVAASLCGGLTEFRLDAGGVPHVGSVRLPNSVGFAGIFAGSSASTPGLVGRFRAWQDAKPALAQEQQRQWGEIAQAGCLAAREGDSQGFLYAVREYGLSLAALGDVIGADIVTADHRAIGARAQRFGVVYKISGAGGGDLGLAFSDDAQALEAFCDAVTADGYGVIDIEQDPQGLIVEELTG
jgi:phosphomevalonate kinase